MTRRLRAHRLRTLLIGAVASLMMMPTVALGQVDQVTIELRPHCENEAPEQCPAFETADPTSQRTNVLRVGDTLDMNVLVRNPGGRPIRSVRAWLSYDAEMLEGVSIIMSDDLPLQRPGEADFAPTQGYAKIAAGTEEGSESSATTITVARVQFRVKAAPGTGGTPIAFYDLKTGSNGHTYVFTAESAEQNVLPSPLGSLVVRISGNQGQNRSAQSSFPAGSQSSGASSRGAQIDPNAQASFPLLQVQNVRVTTEEAKLFIAWDALPSSRLQGYNVYYGTQMGRYLQRRRLASTDTSVTIRDLPVETTYYVAVRAVSDRNEESAFSQEASVEIGRPSTSTAPLLGRPQDVPIDTDSTTAPPNPLEPADDYTVVPGASGAPSAALLLLLACAGIGVFLAFRRQFIAASRP